MCFVNGRSTLNCKACMGHTNFLAMVHKRSVIQHNDPQWLHKDQLSFEGFAMSFMHLLHSPAEIARNVGENAKILRLSKNLSRKTLAEKAGVSESTIKRFEATGLVTLEALILIATALDELNAVTKLFKPEQPSSLDELKNARRKRGMR